MQGESLLGYDCNCTENCFHFLSKCYNSPEPVDILFFRPYPGGSDAFIINPEKYKDINEIVKSHDKSINEYLIKYKSFKLQIPVVEEKSNQQNQSLLQKLLPKQIVQNQILPSQTQPQVIQPQQIGPLQIQQQIQQQQNQQIQPQQQQILPQLPLIQPQQQVLPQQNLLQLQNQLQQVQQPKDDFLNDLYVSIKKEKENNKNYEAKLRAIDDSIRNLSTEVRNNNAKYPPASASLINENLYPKIHNLEIERKIAFLNMKKISIYLDTVELINFQNKYNIKSPEDEFVVNMTNIKDIVFLQAVEINIGNLAIYQSKMDRIKEYINKNQEIMNKFIKDKELKNRNEKEKELSLEKEKEGEIEKELEKRLELEKEREREKEKQKEKEREKELEKLREKLKNNKIQLQQQQQQQSNMIDSYESYKYYRNINEFNKYVKYQDEFYNNTNENNVIEKSYIIYFYIIIFVVFMQQFHYHQ